MSLSVLSLSLSLSPAKNKACQVKDYGRRAKGREYVNF
jgi:hypothetical protein